MWPFSRKSTAQPQAIRTPAELESFLLGALRQSASGIRITPETALQCPAVFACVNVLAQSIGQLPMHVYERKGEEKTRAATHPLHALLHDQPNDYQSAVEFREVVQANAGLYGNGYAYVSRLNGRPIELHPLHSAAVRPERMSDLTIRYHVTGEDGRAVTYAADEIFHLRGFSRNGWLGESPVRHAREAIALALAAERYGALFFKNGAKSKGAFRLPEGSLDEPSFNRLKDQLNESANGDDTHKTPLLERGIEWVAMDHSAKDSQLTELRNHQVVEIARIFRIPPHIVQHLEKSSFSNIEHQSREFVLHTLMPWVRRWEGAVQRQLVQDKSRYFAEFSLQTFLRGDNATRAKYYATAIGGPHMTVNEGRRLENLPPIDGGDELLSPLNMGSPDDDSLDPPEEGSDK